MSEFKKNLLKNLENDVYCRIMPSKKHGVGVFAIKDIPKGKNPFKITGVSCLKGKVLNINESELKNIDTEILKMISDFYHKDEKGFYGIPYKGINANDISFYMNTSKKPNVSFKSSSKCSMVEFFTLKPVKKGHELLINYDEY